MEQQEGPIVEQPCGHPIDNRRDHIRVADGIKVWRCIECGHIYEDGRNSPTVERIEKLEWQFDFLLRYLNEKDILPDQGILSMNDFVKARMDPQNVQR